MTETLVEQNTTATELPERVVLSVDDLHLSYGSNPILKGVSMQLKRGEVVSLLGPSGSGKTTLLRAVAGLESPHKGTITIADRRVFNGNSGKDVPAEGRNLGLVFQSYALWPHKTVFDNVAYGLKLRKVAANEIRQRVSDALTNLGLGQLMERYPHQLSGGQQQRVAIARALVYNPPVILLDEPLSNLDAKLREEARAWLRELIMRLQLSALVVTHDQSEALAMSDRILLLNQGKIEQQGTPQEMYGNPQSLFVADFMGSNNVLKGRISESRGDSVRLDVGEWSLWGKRRGALQTGVEATGVIRVASVDKVAGPGPNCMPVRLITCMYLGDHWEYLLDAQGTRIRAFGKSALPAEQMHWIEIPEDQFWIFS